MQEANEDLRARLQANLDVAAGLCRLGFTYGEQVTTLTTETMHKWVHQADQDPKVLLQGDVAGFTAASGRIAVDHWSALLSCCPCCPLSCAVPWETPGFALWTLPCSTSCWHWV